MECRCGNEIKIKIKSKVNASGCRVLTAVLTSTTVQCLKCGNIFQIPIESESEVVHEDKKP